MKSLVGNQLLTLIVCLICVGLVFTSADSMVIIMVIGILDFLLGANIVRNSGPKMVVCKSVILYLIWVVSHMAGRPFKTWLAILFFLF